jgi:hypothetical protein
VPVQMWNAGLLQPQTTAEHKITRPGPAA